MSPSIRTMGFFMSEINFCNTKEQLNHLGEVVTGKVDGSPSGADIDESTLLYTGQVRRTLPSLEAEYIEAIRNAGGDPLNGGVWAAGQTFTSYNQYMVYNDVPYKPLTTTSLPYGPTGVTPDPSFVEPYVSFGFTKDSAGEVTNYQSDNVSDMILGATVGGEVIDHVVGYVWSSGLTTWRTINTPVVDISDFEPLGNLNIDDFKAPSDPDDTSAVNACFALNEPVELIRDYTYNEANNTSGQIALPQVINGQFSVNCIGQVQFGLRDNSTHILKSFTSDDVFTIDPLVPRSSAQSGVMLITNIEDITNYKCHCDFEYSANVDGSTRGEGFIRIASTVECDLDINSTQTGAIVSTWINPEAGEIHGAIKFKNCETGLLKRSGMSEDLKLELINTPSQILNWRNTTDTVPSKNGKDCILSEASSVKTPETNITMRSYYAIERGAYIQRAGKGKFDGWSYGSDVGKCTDDSEGLEVYATAILTPDGSTEQRYSWQVYGGANGAVKDIDIHPICHNLTGIQGNKEAFSVLGECENITVHQPYGYECGNGLWLLQDAGGIFSPKIDGLTIIGGRAEGENGVTPPNGAISAWFSTVGAGQYLRNLVVDGTTSMPSSSGKDTFLFTNIEDSVSVLNVKVDGVNDSQSYQTHVVITNCEGVTQSAQELYISNSGFLSPKPFAIQRTDLAANSTISKVIATFTDTTVNPANVQVEIRARHNGQPNGNSIDYKALCYVGGTSANFVVNDEVSILASGQSISLTYDEVAKTVTLNHTSSSPLGFDDSTFYSRVMASKEII